MFFWYPLTLLAENRQAALLARACTVLPLASPTELGKDKASPLVPVEKAGDVA